MPFGGAMTAGIVGMGVLGAVAGSQQDVSTQSNTTTNRNQSKSGVTLSGADSTENAGRSYLDQGSRDFFNMSNAGPGVSDVGAATTANRSLADMLDAYSKGGYNPTDADISRSNGLASSLFGAQRTALNQNFTDQNVQAQRQAALMGRDMNDPVLRAKLATEQTRQTQMLDANQGAWATQNSMAQPGMRLGYAQDRAGLLSGLATQAMSNRQALASMGSQIMGQGQQFRLNTAQHYGDNTSTGNNNYEQRSGGGLKGAITGFMGGAGGGMGMASSGMKMANSGGGYGAGGGGGGYGGGAPFSGAGAGASDGGAMMMMAG